MSLPEFQPDKLTTALDQAIYNAHTHRNDNPSLTTLILPDMTHAPYLARNLHTSYVQQIATLPHTHAKQHHNHPRYNLHVYLVAKSKALSQLHATNIYINAQTTFLTKEYGQRAQITKIDMTLLDAQIIDCSESYTSTPTPILSHYTTTILQTKTHNRRWNPCDFIDTDGSQVKGSPTLGAGVVNPKTNSITHIDIKSQPKRHTMNRAELAAIAVTIKQENTEDHMSILTNSSLCINTTRNYTIDPAAYKQHLHKDPLHLTDKLLRYRDSKQLKTHIGKVKSHPDVEYNQTTDKLARAVVEGERTPSTTFEQADPPIGSLRT